MTRSRPSARPPVRLLWLRYAALGLMLCLPSDTTAQESPLLQARARIRVWAEGLPEEGLVGRLFTVDADTLRIFADSALPRVFPVESVRRLEVSRGRHRGLTIGVPLLGAGVGAVLGVVLATEDTFCRLEIVEERECVKETPDAIVGAGAGFIVTGIIVGLLAKERWVAVPLDRLAVQLDPRPRQLVTAVRLRF